MSLGWSINESEHYTMSVCLFLLISYNIIRRNYLSYGINKHVK